MQCDKFDDVRKDLVDCSQQCIDDHDDDDKFDEEQENEYNQCEQQCEAKFKEDCKAVCEDLELGDCDDTSKCHA